MSTPGGIEYNKDILIIIQNNFVEILSDQNSNVSVMGFSRYFSTLEFLLEFLIFPLGGESYEIINSNISRHGEFGDIFTGSEINNHNLGELVSLNTDVFC